MCTLGWRWHWPVTGWGLFDGHQVLAPGFYASQDIRTPVRIAIAVLVITQLFNIVLVPLFKHAGLAMSINLGALINAAWLLVGLRRRDATGPHRDGGAFHCRCWQPRR